MVGSVWNVIRSVIGSYIMAALFCCDKQNPRKWSDLVVTIHIMTAVTGEGFLHQSTWNSSASESELFEINLVHYWLSFHDDLWPQFPIMGLSYLEKWQIECVPWYYHIKNNNKCTRSTLVRIMQSLMKRKTTTSWDRVILMSLITTFITCHFQDAGCLMSMDHFSC